MSTPPPIPPRPSRSDEMLAAASGLSAPPLPSPPPKKGLSGCAIAAIVVCVLGLLLIVGAAILAAIAIPQYQEYILRTRITQAALQAEAMQPSIDALIEQSGACPDNATIGLSDAPEAIGASSNREEILVTTVLGEQDGQCAIVLHFQSTRHPALHGRNLQYLRGDGGWRCTGGTMPEHLNPRSCRAGGATP